MHYFTDRWKIGLPCGWLCKLYFYPQKWILTLKTNFTLLNGVVISHFFLPLASHSNFSVSSPEPVDALGRRLDFFWSVWSSVLSYFLYRYYCWTGCHLLGQEALVWYESQWRDFALSVMLRHWSFNHLYLFLNFGIDVSIRLLFTFSFPWLLLESLYKWASNSSLICWKMFSFGNFVRPNGSKL